MPRGRPLARGLRNPLAMTNLAMPVSAYMVNPVISVEPGTPIDKVYELLEDREISCVPVMEAGGRAVGVLSRTDLLKLGRVTMGPLGRVRALSWPAVTAREAMHEGVITVDKGAALSVAARTMAKHRYHRVFVTEGSELIGVLSTKEVLLAIRDKRVTSPIVEHMSRPVFTIPLSAELSRAMDRLSSAHVGGLVVVDDDHWPLGLFTQAEALLSRDLPPATPLEDAMSYAMLCLHASTPLYRAAGHAHATRARRVLVTEDHRVTGIMTGIDFARAIGNV